MLKRWEGEAKAGAKTARYQPIQRAGGGGHNVLANVFYKYIDDYWDRRTNND